MKRLQNKKVYVGKHSKEIQEKAFELGFEWACSSRACQYFDKPFLFFSHKYITYSNDVLNFNDSTHEEITAEEILSIKVEPKFKPFAKVLVRDSEKDEWRVNLYSHYDSSLEIFRHVCIGGCWKQCIPYEGNEHLLGTTEEILSMKVETEFKPFERVLVRDLEDGEWHTNLYSHYDSSLESYPHVCIGGRFARCIPYEGNEELLGTNKMTNN